jgi:hypothetical protein
MRYGTCEIFYVTIEEQTPATCFWNKDDNEPMGQGYFYWTCLPGCLPEGDPVGPFETSEDAYRDAVEYGYIDDDGEE